MNSFLNSYFDKIYVLALKDDEQRQESIYKQLKAINFDFVWGPNIKRLFPGIKSVWDIPASFFIDNDINREKVLGWAPGGLGCAIGHRNMLREVVRLKLSKALLLEDDIILNPNAENRFNKEIKYLPNDWELLYLGYYYPSKIMRLPLPFAFKKLYGLLKRSHVGDMKAWSLSKSFYPKNINAYFQKAGVYYGGHAYAVTLDAAEKLLELNDPLSIYSDPLLMHAVYHNYLHAYNFKKPLFHQDKSFLSHTE